jgi:hypothetical protein
VAFGHFGVVSFVEYEADHRVNGIEEFMDVDGLRIRSIGELQFEVLAS